MAAIKSKGTKMEEAARPALEALGFEYHPKGVFGNPDFAHMGQMVAVFLDGCWFHGCPEHYRAPKTNVKFWTDKVAANKARDRGVDELLSGSGWRVIRVWEHDMAAIVEMVKH